MYLATIETKAADGKGRSFNASVLAAIQANSLWPAGGDADELRPAFLILAASEGNIRPFVANLRMGNKARFLSNSPLSRNSALCFLKSHKHHIGYQRLPSGVVATFAAPDLFNVNPGMVDPEGINFITLVRKEDLKIPWDQAAALATVQRYEDHLANKYSEETRRYAPATNLDWFLPMIPYAPYVIQMLDCRTRAPLISDPRFYALVLYLLGHFKFAGFSSDREGGYYRNNHEKGILDDFRAWGMESVGFATPLAVKVSHENFEGILKDAATWFMNS